MKKLVISALFCLPLALISTLTYADQISDMKDMVCQTEATMIGGFVTARNDGWTQQQTNDFINQSDIDTDDKAFQLAEVKWIYVNKITDPLQAQIKGYKDCLATIK